MKAVSLFAGNFVGMTSHNLVFYNWAAHKFIPKRSDILNYTEETSCFNIEEIIKNLRNEFFSNLNEVEEFLTKKYENLFRTINA